MHLRCAGIRQPQYTDTWTCHLHRESGLTPHTDVTPLQTQVQSTYPLPPTPPTPPTPPQPKHRHTSHTPPVPTGLVKPKPIPLIHSAPSPPSPPLVKAIHISHYPPTVLITRTTLMHNTSAALDIVPEPRVPHTCPVLTTTTPHPSPTPALPSPSHPCTLSAYTHATQTTVHASQLQKPSSPLKQSHPKYITLPPCVTIGCTRQEVGSLLSSETPLHSLQQTYLRQLMHTTQNFKWPWYTLTILNISQLQTFTYLLQNS